MGIGIVFYGILLFIGWKLLQRLNRFRAKRRLKNYIHVTPGMTQKEVIAIMGHKCTVATLKDGRHIYEWTQDKSKVEIYTNNGIVEEIRPHIV